MSTGVRALQFGGRRRDSHPRACSVIQMPEMLTGGYGERGMLEVGGKTK